MVKKDMQKLNIEYSESPNAFIIEIFYSYKREFSLVPFACQCATKMKSFSFSGGSMVLLNVMCITKTKATYDSARIGLIKPRSIQERKNEKEKRKSKSQLGLLPHIRSLDFFKCNECHLQVTKDMDLA